MVRFIVALLLVGLAAGCAPQSEWAPVRPAPLVESAEPASPCGPAVVRVELRSGVSPEALAPVLAASSASIRGRAFSGTAWTVVLDASGGAPRVAEAVGELDDAVRFVGVEPAPCPGDVLPAVYGGTFAFEGVVSWLGGTWHVETESGAYEMANLPGDLHEVGLRVAGIAEVDRAQVSSVRGGEVARLLSIGPARHDLVPEVHYRPGMVYVTPRPGVAPEIVADVINRRYPLLSSRVIERFTGPPDLVVDVPSGEDEVVAILLRRELSSLVTGVMVRRILQPR
ncbi:hypothetical protein [Rubrivirga sp.]|uniref:hypothetical protein n=1 Tax=Rubrivirga sp. TaxID=1885344 RepID=UPI003B52DBD7